MKLQDHINSTDFDLTESQVKAFLLGAIAAEKPMPVEKAIDELLVENPEARTALEGPLKEMYLFLKTNLKKELAGMFTEESDITAFLEMARERLDFFLTGMSLAGTNVDNCKNAAMAELLDELEDSVEDLDDFLSDSEATPEDGEDFKEFLLGAWEEFTNLKQ